MPGISYKQIFLMVNQMFCERKRKKMPGSLSNLSTSQPKRSNQVRKIYLYYKKCLPSFLDVNFEILNASKKPSTACSVRSIANVVHVIPV